jgi:hypothetical protein
MICQVSNNADRCIHNRLATAWFMSEWPGNILPVPKAFTLLEVQCLLQCDAWLHYQMARQSTRRAGQHTAAKNICTSYVYSPWE